MNSIRFGRGRDYQFIRREDFRLRWDLQSAVQFLNGFRGDAVAMTTFRRQTGSNGPNATDEQVIQSLARQLVAGEFLVALPQRELKKEALNLAEPAPAAAPPPRQAAPKEEKQDAPTFQGGHDGWAQAAVLIEAARSAFPFCEECARATAMAGAR